MNESQDMEIRNDDPRFEKREETPMPDPTIYGCWFCGVEIPIDCENWYWAEKNEMSQYQPKKELVPCCDECFNEKNNL